jgi:steroid 5-alpha reductase family enzyme
MLSAILHLVLPGAALVILMMFVLWLIHLRIGNASIVDPGWAFGLPLVAVTYAVMGSGYFWRRWLLAGMAAVWGLRLGSHLLRRIVGQPEEGRYQELRRQWKANLALKFLAFFEFQALLDLFLSLPFLLAALNPEPTLSPLEYAGTALWLVALAGEALADAQLAAFKRDPASRGQVCQRGLWNYSRHPNYFFEWLIWVAWALFALASPYGWTAVLCPMLMFYFLFRVTGIPATEAQSLRSKGEAYRRYQQTTSAFVPWFRKQARTSDLGVQA